MNTTSTTLLYGGLDLHGNNVFCTLMDAERNIHFEKRLPNDLDAIRLALTPFLKRIKELAVESTCNWYWLVDGLKRLGHTVRLANPARMEENIGLKHADDRTDARFIARQLIHGCLPEGYILPEPARGTRDLLRRRMHLVHDRSGELQRLTSLAARQTGRDLSGNELLTCDLAELFQQHTPSIQMAEASRRHIDFLNAEISALEKRVAADLADQAPDLAHLMSIPGIGPILSRCILLETGPISRFKSAGHDASYCRTVAAPMSN